MQVRRQRGGVRAALDRRVVRLVADGEAGMATAEYAVGTVAAASLAGVLLAILKSEWVRELISDLIRSALGLG
ncbi:DUF4244 domain-containing protein [Georgenia thermotolerans]|uniref:DUF4244 domain-containing protein n=1 Tax=Georgenia thermotolerans TaxID=527326 RepID=A0A7J5UI74_9MICO|nr:DUF4244 domain-containing protein [Georgenia thermotolerans]KAE8762072.1 DUF4244 domain-containing protein [Georgenia thermotolerans]